MAHNKTKRLLIAGVIFLIGLIPALMIIKNEEQDTRSRAGEGTILYFEPQSGQDSPLPAGINQPITLDIMLDPATSLVSSVRLEILYDDSKFAANGTSAFSADTAAFPEVIEGPVVSPGKIAVTLTVGANPTKVIQQITKIARITLTPIETTGINETTAISFGDKTQAVSLSQDEGNQNILSGTSPALIAISEGPAISPTITTTVTPPPDATNPSLYTISCEAKLDDTKGNNKNNKDRASGKAIVLIAADGNKALISLSYKKVGSPVTAVNMHGPAKPGKDGPIAFTLPTQQFNNHELLLNGTRAKDIQDGKYYINIKSKKEPGSALRGQIKGCKQAEGSKIALTVFMHGIGQSGDNENPTSFSLSNKNPLHKVRLATVEVYNTANQLALTQSGNITYDSSSGNFKGTINLGNLPEGFYTIKVKVNKYLQKQIPNIPTLTLGKVTNLPEITLTAGDIIGDNKIDILDFNALTGCYSDLAPPESCQGSIESVALDELDLDEPIDENDLESAGQNFNQNEAADINDDGKVDFTDLTLYMREIKTRPGSQ